MLAMLLCVAGVPVVVLGLIWWSFGVPVTAFRPYINDEVTYWHQALTFSQAGLGGGFYTSSEITNPSGFTPFGAHGPGFPVLYGLIGAAFPWHFHTPVVANLTFVSLATWLSVAFSRLSRARALLYGALLVTFWPLLLWAPTAMQESFHAAGAVAMAGCVAGALAPMPSQTARLAGWPLLAALSFVRPSWLVLMPVWAVASTWQRRPRIVAGAVCGAIALSIAVLLAYSRSTAPFVPPFFFLQAMDWRIGLQALWANVRSNVAMAAALGNYEPFEVVLRLQYWTVMAVLAVALVTTAQRRQHTPGTPYLLAALTAMAAAMGMMIALYTFTNAAEHRVLSAFLLFAGALAAMAPGRAGPLIAAALIASNVATAGVFVHAFKEERQDNFVWDHRGLRELSMAFEAGGIAFHPGAPRWCNTLLTSQYPPFLAAVPGGIGISIVREPDQMQLPPKSHYLLLDDRALAGFARPLHTREIARLPYGTLYVNLEAGCP